MPKLIVVEGTDLATFSLDSDETIVGRHPDSAMHLRSNAVSGTHAKLINEDGAIYLEDLKSRNGTFVNNERIASKVELRDGDQVHFGPVLLRFEGEAQEPMSAFGGSSHVAPFQVGFASEDEDSATITGALSPSGRFGVLETNAQSKLAAVLEISTALAGTMDLNVLLPKVLETLFGIFPSADRGCILLKNEKTGEMQSRAVRHRRQGEDATVRLSRTVVSKVLEEKTGVLSADAAAEFSASQSIADLSIRSMMCVPMLGLDGEPLGIIDIDSQNPLGQFKEDDLELLMAVAGQAALSYENARLMETFLAKQKQDGELAIARDVQRALLPEDLPGWDGWEFFASYDSAQAVGGDYYDAFVLDENKICYAFGDVAGKGVPGALIMSRISSCVQSTMKFCHDPVEAAMAINDHMCDTAVEGRFVTFVLIIIDFSTNEMSVVNAGHMSPLIRCLDGKIGEFDDDKVGPPIGIVEDYPYEVDTRVVEPGETVVVVTDGVDEAMNPAGDLYGKERIEQFIRDNSPKADELGRALLADVRKHADGRPQNDDITIMTIGRSR
jgi:serine phosphatase RsbU (regulator of sigma subunit)